MRPVGDVHTARPRKDMEPTILTPPPNCGTPTSFYIATEEMLGRANQEQTGDVGGSTFGVESLRDTICSVAAEDDNGSANSNNRDDVKLDARRRSTLKLFTRDREGSAEGLERALQADSSPSRSSVRRTSPPSTSESMASLSQNSQLQGLSLPSSPKSTSTRSFKPSDEESMDEAASQAIVSSEEEEEYSVSELQDSAPQLIMPSIKMPSRRPFTDRGKGMGHVKILIAGDSGMVESTLCGVIVDTLKYQKGSARHPSSNLLFRRVKILFMLIHYLRVTRQSSSFDQ